MKNAKNKTQRFSFDRKILILIICFIVGCVFQLYDYYRFMNISKLGLKEVIKRKVINNGESEYYNYFFITQTKDTIWITYHFNSKYNQSDYDLLGRNVFYLSTSPKKYVISPYSPKNIFLNLFLIPILIFFIISVLLVVGRVVVGSGSG